MLRGGGAGCTPSEPPVEKRTHLLLADLVIHESIVGTQLPI